MLEQCVGATWGECTTNRRRHRNGSYTRDLITPTGRIEDLNVPRDREGVASSASAVSRLNQTLTEQFDAWRDHPLLSHHRILKQQRGESKLLTWCPLPAEVHGDGTTAISKT